MNNKDKYVFAYGSMLAILFVIGVLALTNGCEQKSGGRNEVEMRE